jgi:hypothetical protein
MNASCVPRYQYEVTSRVATSELECQTCGATLLGYRSRPLAALVALLSAGRVHQREGVQRLHSLHLPAPVETAVATCSATES